MSNSLRNLGFALALAVSATAMMSSQASALSMSECSIKFRAAKAAGTDAGMKWNDFRKAECGSDAAAAPAAQAAAPAAPAKATAAAPAAPAAAPAAAGGMTLKDCSSAWKGLKASNSVPAGMKWKDFVAAKCVVAGAPAAAPAAPAKMAPAAPAAGKAAAPAAAAPAATGTEMLDKNGKPMSPGRAAMVTRERACGAQWKDLKAKNAVPVGQTWPQFWSACNKQLKAQGK